MENSDKLHEYLHQLSSVQHETELSGRTMLYNILTGFFDKNIHIIHEPKRDKEGRGAPDFKFVVNETIIGYCETKEVGENLDNVIKSEQIQKYLTLTDNLLITDYLRFIWLYHGVVRADIRICEQTFLNTKMTIDNNKVIEFTALLTEFSHQTPEPITSANMLAKWLAAPTRTIKFEITNSLHLAYKNKQSNELTALHEVFKKNIFEEISINEFADAFAQTLSYSLFLTKLNLLNPNILLNLHNIGQHTPTSFALIKDILRFINTLDKFPAIKPYIERIFHVINHTNMGELTQDLSFTKHVGKDPYIYFYEDFLKEYDPQIRVDAGVYYTPEPVVNAIIHNIHNILINEFGLVDGLANEKVKLLDFACGTGTFLLQVYRKILDSVPPNSLKRKGLIENHILKQIYGFELLIPAYCVSHLKLSQFLKEYAHFNIDDKQRIPVYLTNSLESRNAIDDNPLFALLPAFSAEGNKAQEIKDDNDILVITGNPPYNGESKNNSPFILNLIKDYKPDDGDLLSEMSKLDKNCKGVRNKELNIKWLRNDYVKFIRFAENKMARAGRGVVGIITSNSFLDGPIFRKMRQHLMQTFDKIIIIDLHGNHNNKESSPDGTADQNVFDIKEGVAISFFIKNTNIKPADKGVFHYDIYGKRKEKFAQINEIDYKKSPSKINPERPFFEFFAVDKTSLKKYNKGLSLREIFCQFGVGICSKRDEIAYHFQKESLVKVLQDFKDLSVEKLKDKYPSEKIESRDKKTIYAKNNICNVESYNTAIKQMNYRPFINQFTFHTNKSKGFLAYPVYDLMKNFDRPNIAICYTRNFRVGNIYDNVFITDKITDLHYLKVGGVMAPLYIYHDNTDEPDENFHYAFRKFINKKFNNPTAEEVMGYIYAILHCPQYRSDNIQMLKMDFPKISFECNLNQFTRLATLGGQLMDAHLMKNIPKQYSANKQYIGEALSDDVKNHNMLVEKIEYNEKTQQLYFNKTSYFANVTSEIINFTIGGYAVVTQYLKLRRGCNIANELQHIQDIINICQYTMNNMRDIDVVYNEF